jgi:flavin-dependent dehydrogenase
MSATQATVLIIGGGPAGASAAIALARRGIDTLLLERSNGAGYPIGETLAPSANPLLHRLGLHNLLAKSDALPSYGNRSSWGAAAEDREFLRDPHGHGWHLDRPAFNAALLTATEEAGARVWRRARVTDFARERPETPWRVSVEIPDGACMITANQLIDATGRASLVSRRLGIRRRVFDTQIAALAILDQEPGAPPMRDATTLIEATASGWWYSALLPKGQLIVAWFSDPDLLARGEIWQATPWWELLGKSERTALRVTDHGFARPERVQVLAAGSSILPQAAGVGWIAAGDAAAAFDPLSSHGIGSALAGGNHAAEAVAAALNGEPAAFARYTDQILGDYARYLWLRHAYYAVEQRWPREPFWARRLTPTPPPAPRSCRPACAPARCR